MRLEFTADISNLDVLGNAGRGGRIDGAALADAAIAAEAAGIDRVLIEDSGSQDVAAVASYVLHATSVLGVSIQHDAGLVSPEIAARQIATLDQLSSGRVTVHIDPPRGGDAALGHEDSLARLDEYITLLKRLWSNDAPIDHEGRFHRLEGALSGPKPLRDGHVPIAFAGLSGTAIKVAARHADVFVLPAATIDETRLTIERVRAAAACHRRAEAIRFSYPIRLQVRPAAGSVEAGLSVEAQRDIEAFSAWLDSQHIGRAAATARAAGSEATLIDGTAEEIGRAILDYCDIGITDFIVRGLRSTDEIAGLGKAVTPLVRRALAHRGAVPEERAPGVVAAGQGAAWRRRYRA
jgi:alkanesulfonate monooxygenase